jgi:hypothetical protein
VVGAGNLSVVVADESNPGVLLRTFEAFVGLPEGSLVPTKNAANRSLTFAEIELVRQLNVEFHKRRWPDDAHARFVRLGAARRMKTGRVPAPDEPRLPMPKWALERSAEVGAETIETITSLGIRVVGDISALASVPGNSAGDDELTATPLLPGDAAALAVLGAIAASDRVDHATERQLARAISALAAGRGTGAAKDGALSGLPPVPAEAAALAVLGAITASGEVAPIQQKPAATTEVPVEQRRVRAVSTRELVRVVMQRGRRRLRRLIGGRRGPSEAEPGAALGR